MKINKDTIINKLPLILSLIGAIIATIDINYIFKRIPIGIVIIPIFCISIFIGNKINNKTSIVKLGISISIIFLTIFFIGVIFTMVIAVF